VIHRWVNHHERREHLTPTGEALKILLDLSKDTGICVCPAIQPLLSKKRNVKQEA
jgi:hypothetical protein